MDNNFMCEKEKIYKVNLNDDKTINARLCQSADKCSETEIQGKWLGFYD